MVIDDGGSSASKRRQSAQVRFMNDVLKVNDRRIE
jgi:hypothetical protein